MIIIYFCAGLVNITPHHASLAARQSVSKSHKRDQTIVHFVYSKLEVKWEIEIPSIDRKNVQQHESPSDSWLQRFPSLQSSTCSHGLQLILSVRGCTQRGPHRLHEVV